MSISISFAIRTILFLDADEGVIKNMRSCLRIFELILGLKVNLTKSCMAGFHVDDHQLLELANVIGCKVGARPLKY